jgi:hypothetical protein
MQVRHDVIQINNTSATQAISSLRPVSMSWSNVPDYMVMEVGSSGLHPIYIYI